MPNREMPPEKQKPAVGDFNQPKEFLKPEPEPDPIITRLAIPQEMIDDPLSDAWKKHKPTGAQIGLGVAKILAGIAWVVAVLSIAFRVVDVTTDYAFFRTFIGEGSGIGTTESVKRMLSMVAAGSFLIGGVGSGVGLALCLRGASKHPLEGRILLILTAVSAAIAAVIYFA